MQTLQRYFYITLYLSIFFIIYPIQTRAETNLKIVNTWVQLQSQKNFLHDRSNNALGMKYSYKKQNISSNVSLTFFDYGKVSFNNTYVNYKTKHTAYGVGRISRNWSFSPQTSLFLSRNARPSKSIYFKLDKKNPSKNLFFSWLGPYSIEVFNSKLENKIKHKNSLMFGARGTVKPFSNLDLEFIKISQWGGSAYSNSFSSFGNAVIGNTNEGKYGNINQVAGIGFSFMLPMVKTPIRLYGQTLGEDEAGNLPSCLIYLLGVELAKPKFKNKFGIEVVDTRVRPSKNNNCGPGSAYNNKTYEYSNNNVVLGAPIDTEGKSINLYGSINLVPNLNLIYTLKKVIVNDINWPEHRLSSKRQNGWLNSASLIWENDLAKYSAKLSYKDIKLDRTNISKNLTIGIFASVKY